MKRLSAAAFLLVMCALVLMPARDAAAQMEAGGNYAQVGIGALPGIGLHGAFVQARSLYTMEGALYVDFTPRFAGGEGSLQLSGAVGGALRAFGIIRAFGSPAYAGSDLDVGFRLGPSLVFTLGDSARDENPFSLFLEPYARFTTALSDTRTVFVEGGLQRPILRAGIVLSL